MSKPQTVDEVRAATRSDPAAFFGKPGARPAAEAADPPAEPERPPTTFEEVRKRAKRPASEYFGKPAAPPPPKEPSDGGVVDSALRDAGEAIGGAAKAVGRFATDVAEDAVPWVTGDDKTLEANAARRRKERSVSVLDRPADAPAPPAKTLMEQRGGMVSQEQYDSVRRLLASLPRDKRAAMMARTDLPRWAQGVMQKAAADLDQEERAYFAAQDAGGLEGGAKAGASPPQASAAVRAAALRSSGLNAKDADTMARRHALEGGMTFSLDEARAGTSMLNALDFDQAQAANGSRVVVEGGRARMVQDSFGVRTGKSIREGVMQGAAGVTAAALRAAGEEDLAKTFERVGESASVRSKAINEVEEIQASARKLGVRATGVLEPAADMATGAVRSAATSIAEMAPGIALAAMGQPGAAVGLMFMPTFGRSYIDKRAAGGTPGQSGAYAAAMGSLEVLGESLGILPAVTKAFAAKAVGMEVQNIPGAFERYLRKLEGKGVVGQKQADLMRWYGGELAGEEFTYTGQYLIDGSAFGLNKPMSLKEYIAGAMDTALSTVLTTAAVRGGTQVVKKLAGMDGGTGERTAGAPPPAAPPFADTMPAGDPRFADTMPSPDAPAGTPPAAPPAGPAPASRPADDTAPFDAGDLLGSPVDERAHAAATSPANDLPQPTDGQKDAGNYRKGHDRTTFPGLDLSIENPQGSQRTGRAPDGTEWSTTMRSHYGYIKRTEGADGDQVDAFVKPGTPAGYTGPVFIVDQVDGETGEFDEHKVMLGYASPAEAERAYRENYDANWRGFGAMTGLSYDGFKDWLKSGNTTVPITSKVRNGSQPNVAVPAPVAPNAGAAGPDLAGGRDAAVGSSAPEPGPDAVGAGTPEAGSGRDGEPVRATPGPADGAGAEAGPSLSATPDFATSWPRPQIERLNQAGRESMFAGLEDDERVLAGAVQALHHETGFGLQAKAATVSALREAIGSGTDVRTGKRATPQRLKEMQAEARGLVDQIDGTFSEYADEFGPEAEQAFRAATVPELDTLREPVEAPAPPAPAPAPEPAPAPPAPSAAPAPAPSGRRAQLAGQIAGIMGGAPAAPAAPQEAPPAGPRTLDVDGRASDGKPINPGDTFRTSSGRTTTPYPTQKGEKHASQWLIDNATAEADARDDEMNVAVFGNEKPMRSGELAPASRDSMLEYLFGEQPPVPPPVLRPAVPYLKSMGGVSPNRHGTFGKDDPGVEVLEMPARGAFGARAHITTVQLENGKWIAAHDADTTKGDLRGGGSPLSATPEAWRDTREEAVGMEAGRLVMMGNHMPPPDSGLHSKKQQQQVNAIVAWAKGVMDDMLRALDGPAPTAAAVQVEPKAAARRKAKGVGGHPRTIYGSTLLAEISRQLGGISPSLLHDLSFKREFGRIGRDGRRPTSYFNPPAGKGIGGLFREGGVADTNELAQWMETEGYIPRGTYEADYKAADEMARSLVTAALNRNEPETMVEREEAAAAAEDQEREAYYAALAAEAAEEAEAERRAIMDEAGITSAEMDTLDDDDIAFDAPLASASTTEDAMRALGFTDQEIADEIARTSPAAQGAPAVAGGLGGQAQAGQDAPAEPGPAAAPGEAAPGPADGPTVAAAEAVERQRADFAVQSVLDEEAAPLAERVGIDPAGISPADLRTLLLAADPVLLVEQLDEMRAETLLAPQTEQQLRTKAEREAAAVAKERAAKAAEQERLRKEAEARDAKVRADQTVDDFVLGASAEQQMSGMSDLFAPPPTPPVDNAPAGRSPRDTALIAARKRVAGLRALRDCLTGKG